MKAKLLFILTFCILLAGCGGNPDEEITVVIRKFYTNSSTDFRTTVRELLSAELNSLIDQAIAREKASAETIMKSPFPTDKPELIEGSIFTSLYEGQTSFTIGKITVNEDSAIAQVEFKNSNYKFTFKNHIAFVNESGWKIDNVLFQKVEDERKSTKGILREFVEK